MSEIASSPRSSRPPFLLAPLAAILAAVCLWGVSFPAMRVAVRVLSPWTVMWVRMVLALALLAPFAARSWPKEYRKGDWKLLLPLVLAQPCLYFLMESYALRFTTASQAGVITASAPLMVSVGAWLFLSEKLSAAGVAGLFLSVAGVVGLTLLGGPGGAAESPWLGNSLELGAMVCAAVNILLVKKLSRRYSPWFLTALQFLAGAVFFLPGLGPLLRGGLPSLTPQLVRILVFLGAGVTVGAFGLYNWSLSRIPASRASVFINLVPVVAVGVGWTTLGESLTAGQLAAALAVIGGVMLGQRRPRRTSSAAHAVRRPPGRPEMPGR